MTVAATVRKAGPTVGNSLATVFPFAFKVFSAADLLVQLTTIASGAVSTLVLNDPLGYTVALNVDQNANPGGSITYNPSGVPLPATQSLTISSVVPQAQGTHIINGGAFFANNIEDAVDKAVINVQDLAGKVGASLQFPAVDSAALNAILPPAATRANMAVLFDGAGNVITGAVPQAPVAAAWLPVVQAATLALGRAAMGVSAVMDAVITAVSAGAALAGLTTQQVAFTGRISPAQIAADQNDYNPANLATAAVLRLSSDIRRAVTGLQGGADGRELTIQNVGTFPILFKFENVASAAANRFNFGCSLGGGQVMHIHYDSTVSRWRAKAKPEPIGTVKDFGTSTMPEDFLAIDQNVSRVTFAALFNEIGTAWGAGDGVNTFGLFMGAGRALIAAGAGLGPAESVLAAAVTTATDAITVAANNKKWITGQIVQVSTTTTLPAPLVVATNYFVVRIDNVTIKLATSLANAQNGTVIDITTQGVGTHTITGAALQARTHGELLGEDDHAMSVTELLAHGHTTSPATVVTNWNGVNNDTGGGTTGSFVSTSVGNKGGNAAANVMQSSAVVTRGIRFC